MDLKDRVAVITGATGGLGSTLARALAAQNAHLALLDIDPAKLEKLAQSLSLPASRLFTQTVDLLDPAGTKSAAAGRSGQIRQDRYPVACGGRLDRWQDPGRSALLTTWLSCSTSTSGPASMSFRPSYLTW